MSKPEALTDETPKPEEAQKPAPDAMAVLSSQGREPIRIWKTTAPKIVGGDISAVLCQDTNEIVLVHTLASGKFSVFVKAK